MKEFKQVDIDGRTYLIGCLKTSEQIKVGAFISKLALPTMAAGLAGSDMTSLKAMQETASIPSALAMFADRLDEAKVRFRGGSCCCVVLASQGYPGAYETGFPIDLGGAEEAENVFVFHAGTKSERDHLVTSGGRVLGVSALGENARAAQKAAYAAAANIRFERSFCRMDIGSKAIAETGQGEN